MKKLIIRCDECGKQNFYTEHELLAMIRRGMVVSEKDLCHKCVRKKIKQEKEQAQRQAKSQARLEAQKGIAKRNEKSNFQTGATPHGKIIHLPSISGNAFFEGEIKKYL